MAVNPAHVISNFKQSTNSCTLGAYAVAVARGRSERQPPEFFQAYCRQFGIPFLDPADAEAAYDADFHVRIQTKLGNAIIESLHLSSSEVPFVSARSEFELELVHDVKNDLVRISVRLRSEDCLLCASVGSGAHSIVVGWWSGEFFVADTNKPGDVERGVSITLDDPVDGLLVTRR